MLVAAPERWDEACFCVPALRALMAAGLKVGVVCVPEQMGFWQSLPGLARIERPRKTRELAQRLAGKWRAAWVWEAGMVADAVKQAGVGQRMGPAGGKLARRLTHPLTIAENPADHRVVYYLSMARKMGVTADQPEWFAPAEIGVVAEANTVLLAPESDFGTSHEWPLEHWLGIARKLAQAGMRLTVAGAGGRKTGPAMALAGAAGVDAGFLETASLGDALPQLAAHRWVIAADGSVPHLASHAGAVCITLFGPNDPQWKRPLGRRHAVLRRHVECAPCMLAKCPLDLRCQNELDPGRVWEVIRGMTGI